MRRDIWENEKVQVDDRSKRYGSCQIQYNIDDKYQYRNDAKYKYKVDDKYPYKVYGKYQHKVPLWKWMTIPKIMACAN